MREEGRPYDAIVLGAGISGLVAASILSAEGGRVLVIDEYRQAGGNHIDVAIGGYTFDIGSLIFQDDSPLLRHFPELLPLYVPIEPSWSRLNPQGLVTAYPFSVRDDVLAAGPIEIARIALSVAAARLFARRIRNAGDFARYWVGERFLERSGLGRYMERFYGSATHQIDHRFAEKRMMWLRERARPSEVLRLWLRPQGPPAANRQLARPREGFAPLYEAALARLRRAGVAVELGRALRSVRRSPEGFRVGTQDGERVARRLVSTVPLGRIQALAGLPVSPLRSVTLLSLFFSFAGERGFADAILYNFSHGGMWKRLTVYSDFYGRAEGREFFAVEVTLREDGTSAEEAEGDFRDHVRANGLFRGDLRLEGHHRLTNAYPTYLSGAADHAADAVAELRALGIESLGRQGAFNYQPTARVSTLDVEAALAP